MVFRCIAQKTYICISLSTRDFSDLATDVLETGL